MRTGIWKYCIALVGFSCLICRVTSPRRFVRPEDDVALSYYRLERCFSGIIDLDSGKKIEVKSPADIGTRKAKDREIPLSNIIEVLNQRFHTEFKEEDRLSHIKSLISLID